MNKYSHEHFLKGKEKSLSLSLLGYNVEIKYMNLNLFESTTFSPRCCCCRRLRRVGWNMFPRVRCQSI